MHLAPVIDNIEVGDQIETVVDGPTHRAKKVEGPYKRSYTGLICGEVVAVEQAVDGVLVTTLEDGVYHRGVVRRGQHFLWTHHQVAVWVGGDLVPIDIAMVDLVCAVNEAGLVTDFSCQGSELPPGEITQDVRMDCFAYLLFGDIEHAKKFIECSLAHGWVPVTAPDGSGLTLEQAPLDGRMRGVVRFLSEDVKVLTKLWS